MLLGTELVAMLTGVLSAMLWSHVGLRPYGRVGEDAIFTGRQDDQKTFVEVG